MSRLDFRGLLTHGNALEARFDSLPDNHPELQDCLSAIREWLERCVDYGRFLPDRSPDRRALQGRVDYWTSLLWQRGHPLSDIDRIADFDPEAGFPLDIDFPYPGLTAYSEEMRAFFCGREREANEGVAHLEQNNALLLVSESGGGKSSLAMAGILPILIQVHPDWLYAPRMTPGAHPVDALLNVLCAVLPALRPKLSVEAASEESAHVAVQPVIEALGGRTLVLFIDQLEELLTLCNDSRQQAAFSALLEALTDSTDCRVLATMRSDHQHQLANSQTCRVLFSLLAANNSVKTLAPLGFDEIRTAILKPAQAVGLRFVPPEIVDKLAQQTANLVGGLPLLQFALWRLWESRPKRGESKLDLINEEQLKKLPSVQAALGEAAQAQYEHLTPSPLQGVCERLMQELTVLAENYQDPMRRRRSESEVVDVLERYKQITRTDVTKLINDFVDAKLLVRTGKDEDAQIEVAHEAIFRNWEKFRGWVSGEETKARLQAIRLIGREAAQWMEEDQAADYLKLKGEPLSKALDYTQEGWLDEASRTYVKHCERAERRRWWSWRFAWGITGVLLVVGALFWYEQIRSKQDATAAVRNLMPLSSLLQPWNALNLTTTLHHHLGEFGDFSAPLAHVADRMEGTQMLGNRKLGIDFTASGTAVIQLERHTENLSTPPTQVAIYPINDDPIDESSVTQEPISIKLPNTLRGSYRRSKSVPNRIKITHALPCLHSGRSSSRGSRMVCKFMDIACRRKAALSQRLSAGQSHSMPISCPKSASMRLAGARCWPRSSRRRGSRPHRGCSYSKFHPSLTSCSKKR